MDVLVTGGGGFLGSFICDVHIERGDKVVALDLSDGAKVAHLDDHPNFRFLSTTVTDEATMREEIRTSDLVYHLAAVADPRRYVEDPLHTLQLDLIAGLHVVDWVVEAKRPLVFT
ncbi:MAG TPA: nucleoside-diphosphate sugar epimerase, partial [Chloroflexi bacterium]|nr:nucleoside-diphosphate sugar epimerase [Chloroflexota bacterium]